MRGKLAFVLTGALCLALAGSVAAYNPNGVALPAGATEVEVYYRELVLDENNQPVESTEAWERLGLGSPTQLARSWNSGVSNGYCNKAYWDFTFTSHASVAQWINWNLAGTRKDWRILKPGEYASDSITFNIASNNDVMVFFAGFDDLKYLGGEVPEGTQDTIETWYSIGGSIEAAESNGWIRAADLNEEPLVIPNSNALHYGQIFKIWQKIRVEPSNNSSEYENIGQIRLAITNLKFWVDPESGQFTQNQFGEPPLEPWAPQPPESPTI